MTIEEHLAKLVSQLKPGDKIRVAVGRNLVSRLRFSINVECENRAAFDDPGVRGGKSRRRRIASARTEETAKRRAEKVLRSLHRLRDAARQT